MACIRAWDGPMVDHFVKRHCGVPERQERSFLYLPIMNFCTLVFCVSFVVSTEAIIPFCNVTPANRNWPGSGNHRRQPNQRPKTLLQNLCVHVALRLPTFIVDALQPKRPSFDECLAFLEHLHHLSVAHLCDFSSWAKLVLHAGWQLLLHTKGNGFVQSAS